MAARTIARRFDIDPEAALAEARELLARRVFAGKVLQQLNRLDRHEIVTAIAALVTIDAKTHEQVVTEIARGLAQSGAPARAEALLASAAATRRADYNFNLAAGKVLAEVRLHEKALPYFEAAFAARPTDLAAERVFLAYLQLQRYDEAAGAMGRILRTGSYRDTMARDFAFLLQHIGPGHLDPEIAYALSALPPADDPVGSALMPHLIAQGALDGVLGVVDRDIANFGSWDEKVLLQLIDYLVEHGKIDHLLRINDQYDGGSVAVAQAIARVLDAMPVAQMTQFLSPNVSDFLGNTADAKSYREIAARFAKTANAEDALRLVRLIPKVIAPDDRAKFYAREKSRLSRLALHAIVKLDRRADTIDALVAVALAFVEPQVAQFFTGDEARELAATFIAARRQRDAPEGARLALLRDGYFPFHIERRFAVDPDSLVDDVRFTEAAFDYFYSTAQLRPALTAPTGEVVVRRLTRPALLLDSGRSLDVLTSWGLMQAQPKFSLANPAHLDLFHTWYLTTFFGLRRMPPDAFNPQLVAYFNEIVVRDEISGLPATRYLRLTAKSPQWRRAFDLANIVDRNLFVLTLVATVLPQSTQFLPFLKAFLSAENVLARMIVALGGRPLLDALDGPLPAGEAARAGGGPKDILLVGHASKETGLGRNYGMLKKGLEGFKVTGLDFEANADQFNEELKRWRAGLRSRPLAVFAVNAHDLPDAFVKDRHGVLADCHVAGFFLWEVSRIPRVQSLGVSLVDEVWAPTRYVASIYAPLKPTHVVGKGLFEGDEAALKVRKVKGQNPRFTFVTAFDFDSSIERKNPLAVVEAFQQAFRGPEKVELIVKTSNVNPRHWSNAERQWERLVAAAAPDKRIRLVTARYTDDEMTALVRDADCIVSLHRSEGFGYLMSDAMAFGVPVIATGHSGNADFCTPETSWPVAWRPIPVPAGAARWIVDGAEWADPDIASAAAAMRAVFSDYDAALARAAKARENIATAFGMAAFRAALAERIGAIAGA